MNPVCPCFYLLPVSLSLSLSLSASLSLSLQPRRAAAEARGHRVPAPHRLIHPRRGPQRLSSHCRRTRQPLRDSAIQTPRWMWSCHPAPAPPLTNLMPSLTAAPGRCPATTLTTSSSSEGKSSTLTRSARATARLRRCTGAPSPLSPLTLTACHGGGPLRPI